MGIIEGCCSDKNHSAMNTQGFNPIHQQQVYLQATIFGIQPQIVLLESLTTQPYMSNGLLLMYEDSNSQRQNYKGVGTAFLLSPNIILTVAHNTMTIQRRRIINFKYFLFFPRQNNYIDYDKGIQIESFRIPQKFQTSNQITLDYCICKLKQPVYLTQYLYLCPNIPNQQFADSEISIYGYPRQKGIWKSLGASKFKPQVNQFGLIRQKAIRYNSQSKVFQHQISTLPGHSGSPICILNKYKKQKILVIGLHSGTKKAKQVNYGVPITKQMIYIFKKWVKQLKGIAFNVERGSNKLQWYPTEKNKQNVQINYIKQKSIINLNNINSLAKYIYKIKSQSLVYSNSTYTIQFRINKAHLNSQIGMGIQTFKDNKKLLSIIHVLHQKHCHIQFNNMKQQRNVKFFTNIGQSLIIKINFQQKIVVLRSQLGQKKYQIPQYLLDQQLCLFLNLTKKQDTVQVIIR